MSAVSPLLSVHLRLLGMAILWGASWPWGRILAQTIPPITASTLRFLIASGALIIWLYHHDHFKAARFLTKKQWIGLLATGAIGVFAYAICFLSSLQYLPSGKASAAIALNPAFTLILAALFLKEKLNKIIILGIILAIFGALYALSQGHPIRFLSGNLHTGEYLLLTAVICWVAYTLLGRIVLKGIDSLTATTISSIFGTILLLITSITVEGQSAWESFLQAPSQSYIALICLALGSTTLAYAWYFNGIKALGAGNAAAYTSLVPVFGILISAVWLGEPLHLSLLIGAPLAIFGMLLMNIGQRQ
ncbi:DMT family transporter [Pelistega ratti]|nr:DMT family transporter [Pelistega ratti]